MSISDLKLLEDNILSSKSPRNIKKVYVIIFHLKQLSQNPLQLSQLSSCQQAFIYWAYSNEQQKESLRL